LVLEIFERRETIGNLGFEEMALNQRFLKERADVKTEEAQQA
jgi:hypothetical protein